MQVFSARIHTDPLQKKSQGTTLTGKVLSDEALRNMPAPARVNGLQWELSSTDERRRLLKANQEPEQTEDAASTRSSSANADNPMDRLARIVQQYQSHSQTPAQPPSSESSDTSTPTPTNTTNSATQSTSEQDALNQITQQFQQRFADTAQDKNAFHALMEKTFGGQYDYAKAETIRQQTLNGDFSWMPEIQLVDGQELADISGTQGGEVGKGAYSAAKDTVYLSRDLLNSDPAEAEKILAEEVGHAIDARINVNDAKGDEGDIFSRLVHGEAMSNAELAQLQQENDSGTIEVNGEKVEVEFGCCKSLRKKFKKLGKSLKKGFKKIKKSLKKIKKRLKKIKDKVKKLGQKVIDVHKKMGRSIEKGFKKAMQSKLLGNIMTVLQWIPIPIFAVIAQVYNVLKAGYMVYQGIKHKSFGMALSGAAGFVGGAGKLAGAAGFTNIATKAASVSGNLSKAALAHQAIGEKDLTSALALVNGQVGNSNPLKSTLNTATAASSANDAAKSGDYLGATRDGATALQGVTGPKGDQALQFIGKNAGVLSTAEQAVDSGNYAKAGEALYNQYSPGGATLGVDSNTQAANRGGENNTTQGGPGSVTSSGEPQTKTARTGKDNDQPSSEAQTSPADLPSPATPEPLADAQTETSVKQNVQQQTQVGTATLSGDDSIAEDNQKSRPGSERESQPKAAADSDDTSSENETRAEDTSKNTARNANILEDESKQEAQLEGRGAEKETHAQSKPPEEAEDDSWSTRANEFSKGAVGGDYYENDSLSASAGKFVGGFHPAADARDVSAAVTHIAQGKEGAWSDLGWSLVGSIPLVGDTIKAVGKGSDVAKVSGKNGDDVAGTAKSADAGDGVKNTPFGNIPEAISTSSGVPVKPTPNKTTTILGSYAGDMDNIINHQLQYPKTIYFDAKTGGFNVLNVPDEMYKSPDQFWDEINRPFLDQAIKRGDEIPLATKPKAAVLYRDDGSLTGFGREIDYLAKNGYKYDSSTGTMTKGAK